MKISVCIPTYNQADYIAETIESVVNQTVQPTEIVVSNDCSTDTTAAVLQQLATQIPILKIVNQPKNLGMSRNTDYALRAGTGDIIVKLDSDDKLLPQYIEKLSGLLQQYPQAGYAHADVEEINEQSIVTKNRVLFRKTGFVPADNALKEAVKGYKVAANIIMFRKAALESVGFIQSLNNFAEDFYLSVNMADAGWGNVYYNETLSQYRVWSDAGQVRQKRKMIEVIGLTLVFNDAFLPAFRKRNWNENMLYKARETFAISHASSLGWDIYTRAEKEELKAIILQLSDSPRVQKCITTYLSGNTPTVSSYERINHQIKDTLKQVLKKLTL